MRDSKKEGEDALLQLRSEMLTFVLDELTLRAAERGDAVLGEPLVKALRAQIKAAVSDAMAAEQWADAERIAAFVVKRMKNPDADLPRTDDEGRTGGQPKREPGDPPPRKGGSALLARLQQPNLLGLLLFLAVAAFAVVLILYRGSAEDLKAARSATERTQISLGQAADQICAGNRRIRDQLRMLLDTRVYQESCADGRPNRSRNPLCVSVRQIDLETNQPGCQLAGPAQ